MECWQTWCGVDRILHEDRMEIVDDASNKRRGKRYWGIGMRDDQRKQMDEQSPFEYKSGRRKRRKTRRYWHGEINEQ